MTFAFCADSFVVFRVRLDLRRYLRFAAMRIGTLILDNISVVTLLSFGLSHLHTKAVSSVLVIVINYTISKFVIFKKGRDE